MRQDVNAMFADAQSISGLGLVAEDMGLDEGQTLLMDETLSEDELATLNQEVTPEIERLLIHAAMAHAMADLTTWEASRVETREEGDYEAAMDAASSLLLMEVALETLSKRLDKGMAMIRPLEEMRRRRYTNLDSWCKRYNTFKFGSPEKPANPKTAPTTQAWRSMDEARQKRVDGRFFKELKKLSTKNRASKAAVKPLWNLWNSIRSAKADLIDIAFEGKERNAATVVLAWRLFFQMSEGEELGQELNRYFTNGSTDEVDDQRVFWQTQLELSWEYSASSIAEEAEYDSPEASGKGYWRWEEEKLVERANARREEEEEYMDSFESMVASA